MKVSLCWSWTNHPGNKWVCGGLCSWVHFHIVLPPWYDKHELGRDLNASPVHFCMAVNLTDHKQVCEPWHGGSGVPWIFTSRHVSGWYPTLIITNKNMIQPVFVYSLFDFILSNIQQRFVVSWSWATWSASHAWYTEPLQEEHRAEIYLLTCIEQPPRLCSGSATQSVPFAKVLILWLALKFCGY